MTNELPMPTRGPYGFTVIMGDRINGGWPCCIYGEDSEEVCCEIADLRDTDVKDKDEALANQALILAAFNVAEEARKMGADPIGGIQSMPEMHRVLDTLLASIDARNPRREPGFGYTITDNQVAEIRGVLALARTREVTP